jgi:hypothetical protein
VPDYVELVLGRGEELASTEPGHLSVACLATRSVEVAHGARGLVEDPVPLEPVREYGARVHRCVSR